MTIFLLILILVVLVLGLAFLANESRIQQKRVYDVRDSLKADLESGLDKQDETLVQINKNIAKVLSEATENREDINKSLLEVVTAITRAFMQETIEIKQGVEAIVDVLSSAAAPAETTTGRACQVKDCGKPATVEVPWKSDVLSPAEDVAVCDAHAQMMAKQQMQAHRKVNPKKKVVCEDGWDHTDDPDYVPGQIHAHVNVPTREEFMASEGIEGDGPSEDVLKPAPLDDISAAIEAAYQSKKKDIHAALDAQPGV